MNLPEGLTARPLTLDDVDDTIAMVNTCELVDSGELMWERADLLADTSVEGFDPDADWVGVFDGDRIVAWAFLQGPRHVWIDVAPDARGRGVGTALRRWAVDRARARGNDRLGQTIDDRRTDVGTMLRTARFTPRHTSWILRMEHPTEPPKPEQPAGIEIRPVRLPEEELDTLEMFETAFSEFDDRLPTSIETWRSTVTQREGFVPDDLVIAVDGDLVVGGRVPDRRRRDLGGQARGRRDPSAPWDRPSAPRNRVPTLIRRAATTTPRSRPTRAPARSRCTSAWGCTSHDRSPTGRSISSAVGGGRGIRTLGRVAPPHAFQACPFGRSGRPPRRSLRNRRRRPKSCGGTDRRRTPCGPSGSGASCRRTNCRALASIDTSRSGACCRDERRRRATACSAPS